MGMLLRRKKHKTVEKKAPTTENVVGVVEKTVKEEKPMKKVVGKAKKEV